MKEKILVTKNQIFLYEKYKNKEMKKTIKNNKLINLFKLMDMYGYEEQEKEFNEGDKVRLYYKGEEYEAKVFGIKVNNTIGGFSVLVRVLDEIIECNQKELYRL
jgi:hypothetical protein